jgi:hypothetical protein
MAFLLATLLSCNTIIYERIGYLSYWRPQTWLTDREEYILNDLMKRKERCVGKAFISRKSGHITVYFAERP